eukprot:3572308-Prymnesium_polylepis.1
MSCRHESRACAGSAVWAARRGASRPRGRPERARRRLRRAAVALRVGGPRAAGRGAAGAPRGQRDAAGGPADWP